jgi:hypothetical protein
VGFLATVICKQSHWLRSDVGVDSDSATKKLLQMAHKLPQASMMIVRTYEAQTPPLILERAPNSLSGSHPTRIQSSTAVFYTVRGHIDVLAILSHRNGTHIRNSRKQTAKVALSTRNGQLSRMPCSCFRVQSAE